MGKGKKQKQLSPEEQRERAERRRMANGGAPPGDQSSSSGAAKGGKRSRGHRQKGGGTVMKSRGDITVSGVVMKEWQRTPKQLLHEWTQKQKRPRPQYQMRPAKPPSHHRVSTYLLDKKNKERSLRFTPDQSFPTLLQAQHAAALMSLKGIDASIPHERKLPEPFRTMWLELVGRSGVKEVTMTKKELKKAKAAAKRAAQAEKKLAKLNAIKADTQCESDSRSKSSTGNVDAHETGPSAPPDAPSAPNRRGRGAPTEAVSLTSSQKYASHYERRQAYEAKDAERAAKRRIREKKIRDNPDAAVVMSEANRMYVQEILKTLAAEGSDSGTASGNGGLVPRGSENPEQTAEMQREIEALGFSSDQAALALRWRGSSVSEALTWLMLNIPEEDLPSSFEPGKASKIGGKILFSEDKVEQNTPSIARQKDAHDMSEKQAMPEPVPSNSSERKLVDCGFKLAHVRAALASSNGQCPAALQSLYLDAFAAALKEKGAGEVFSDEEEDSDEDNSDSDADPLADEVMVLESMYPDTQVEGPLPDKNRGGKKITLNLGDELGLMFKGKTSELDLWLPIGSNYPKALYSKENKMECIVLVRNSSFDTQTRQRVTDAVIEKLHKIYKETGGRQGVLNEMVQWCEQSLRDIVQSRPRGNNSHVDHKAGAKPLTLNQLSEQEKQPRLGTGSKSHNASQMRMDQRHAKKRSVNRSHITHIHSKQERDSLSKELKLALDGRPARASADPCGFGRIMSTRARLPAGKHSAPIVQAICENRVVLIAGETGCGKTTQVPQFVLDDLVSKGRGGDCNIVCTQPRRIAAIGVAERVAQKTRLLFCTTGILLRRMHGDPDLKGVTHVIVDEVHERNVDTDFLLAILRALVHRKGSTVKVVLMSATMDAQLFVRYFESSHHSGTVKNAGPISKLSSPPPVISVPGFVYPVEEIYLEDILEKSGYTPRGAKGWRNAGDTGGDNSHAILTTQGDDGGDDDGDAQPDPQDDGSKSVRPYELDRKSHGQYSRFTLESLQKLSHGSHANSWEKKSGAATQQRTDYDLIAATVMLADSEALAAGDDGAILVFMSGTMEISKAIDAIRRAFSGDIGNEDAYSGGQSSHRALNSLQILPLHGSLTSGDQQRIFRRPPRGVRKVVVATNIAETSITIDDCSVVIDTGRFKETRYDPTNRMACLVEAWVSQASSRQRRGRAGRVRKGRCYRLFTRSAYARLPSSQDPEMHRVPLENMCLQIRLLGLGKPGKFLASVIEPPPRKSIKAAVHHLRALGAFSANGSELTPLGQHLARMPLDPQIGKMLVFGALMRCTEDVLTIAAALCSRSPFLSPIDRRDEANSCKAKLAGPSRSDHIALLRAYHGWEKAGKGRRQYCSDNFLSYDGMRQLSSLRRQLGTALFDAGFSGRHQGNSSERENDFKSLKSTNVLRAALCAGMYPNIIHIRKPPKVYYEMNGGNFEKTPSAKELKFYCRKQPAEEKSERVQKEHGPDQRSYDNERVFLHPSSVNFKEGGFVSPWMVYFQKVKTSRVFIRDCTMVPPYAMLLFGGQLEVQHTRNKIVIDGWMYFDAPARVAVLIQELRRELDLLLGRKIEHPEIDISSSPLIDAITRLLVKAGY
eukprot:g372.t1